MIPDPLLCAEQISVGPMVQSRARACAFLLLGRCCTPLGPLHCCQLAKPAFFSGSGASGGQSWVLFLSALPVAMERLASAFPFRKYLLNVDSRDAKTNFYFFQSLEGPHMEHLGVTAVN